MITDSAEFLPGVQNISRLMQALCGREEINATANWRGFV
jgi:hypothetical protein